MSYKIDITLVALLEEAKTHPTTQDCDDLECLICSVRDCPNQEPLHYHHDGCPACAAGSPACHECAPDLS